MAILGLIFEQRQRKTIIGVKDDQDSLDMGQGILPEVTGGLGGIVVDATISEEHTHTCEVTDNPVEDGVKIADHVQLNPAQLVINGVITDTPLGFGFIGDLSKTAGNVGAGLSIPGATTGDFQGGQGSLSIQAFNKMLDLQKSRQPFTVITGLKRYQNMIMTELSIPRTVQTANAIHFKASFKEVRIVKSQTTQGKPSNGSKDAASPTKDKGTQSSEQASPGASGNDPNASVLKNLWG